MEENNKQTLQEKIVYCSQCGIQNNIDSNFCSECGYKIDSLVKVGETEKKTTNSKKNNKINKKTFFVKLISEIIIAMIVCVVIWIVGNFFIVSSVKKSSSYLYPNVTYGEALESFFDNTNWVSFLSDDNEIYVHFTGECYNKNGKIILVEVDFVKTRDEVWGIECVKYDSIDQNIYEIENFIDLVCTVGDDEMVGNMAILYTINDYIEDLSMNNQNNPMIQNNNEIDLLTTDMTGVYYDAQYDETIILIRHVDSEGRYIYHLAYYIGDDMYVLEYGCNVILASWGDYIGGQWYSVSINQNGTLGISGGTGGISGNFEKISSYAEIKIDDVEEYTNIGNVNGYSNMNIEIIRPDGNVYH